MIEWVECPDGFVQIPTTDEEIAEMIAAMNAEAEGMSNETE